MSKKLMQLQEKSRERTRDIPKGYLGYTYHEVGQTRFKDLPRWEKQASSMAWAITHQPVYVYPDDTIIGRVYHGNQVLPPQKCPDFDFIAESQRRCREKYPEWDELAENQLIGVGALGHINWNYKDVLNLGVAGIQAQFEAALKTAKDETARQFYTGVLIMLEALLEWNDQHVAVLERQGMHGLAALCRKVPRHPAENFREAVQAYYFQHLVVMMENPYGGNSNGRLDYFLWPYLKADLDKGAITMEEAKDLVGEMFLRLDERLATDDDRLDAWVECATIGGTNADGTHAITPLTCMMIELAMELDNTHPSIYVRIPKDPPQDYVALCARYLTQSKNRAQFYSDPAVLSALQHRGISFEEATTYACGGCMEISIQGKTSDFIYIGWQNAAKMMELMVTGGISLPTGKRIEGFNATKSLAGYTDFESFYEDFIAEATRLTRLFFDCTEMFSEVAQEYRPAYLMSGLLEDCLGRGRNMHAGGAKYHDYGGTHLAIPNVADAMNAIKQAVFDDKLCTAEEMLAAIKANYVGHEKLRAQLDRIPKYGCEDPKADAMAARVMHDIANIYDSYTTRWGGRGRAIELNFLYTPVASEILGATADGGRAGRMIAQAVTPQSGGQTRGLTAAMNSAGRMPFDMFTGGASAMWDMEKSWATPAVAQSILRAFVQGGTQIFQGNVTSVDELLAAKKKPEEYRNLCVRVGGYSAHFVTLDEDLQNDIIHRIMHRA